MMQKLGELQLDAFQIGAACTWETRSNCLHSKKDPFDSIGALACHVSTEVLPGDKKTRLLTFIVREASG